MKELTNEKSMTIKEVAIVFDVDVKTIQRKVKELYPDMIKHGKTTYINEEQVTRIKKSFDKNVELTTEIEMQQKAIEVLRWMNDKVKILQEENEQMKPKAISYDAFIESKNLHDMSEVAKMLSTGRNKLFAFLRENKIMMENNEPYQKFVDSGYFEIKQKVIATGESVAVSKVTAKGIVFIEKYLKKDIVKCCCGIKK